jgi:hypothetical protein
MLGTVKDEHLARDGFCGYHIGVLRHVARAVDLALMVDFLHDVDTRLACG